MTGYKKTKLLSHDSKFNFQKLSYSHSSIRDVLFSQTLRYLLYL